ncbi:MAG: GspE/PulE/PilB domain-containing protein [Myxococcales bacterium]
MSAIGSGHRQIGQLLLEAGVIDDLQLRSALGHQRQWGGRLGRILLELKFIDEQTLAGTLAHQLGLESLRIAADVDPGLLALVPQTVAERYWIFPVAFKDGRGGGELTVAVADPTNLAAVEDVRFHTGKRVRIVVAPEGDIEAAIKRFYYGDRSVSLPGNGGAAEAPAAVPAPGSEGEEEFVELEPLAELAPEGDLPAGSVDPLAQLFEGMDPGVNLAAPTGEASFDLSAPVLDPEAAAPVAGAAAFFEEPSPQLEVREAAEPSPLQIGASAFDSPQLPGLFDAPSGAGQPLPGAPLGEMDWLSPAEPPPAAGIPTETQPVVAMVVPAEAFPPESVPQPVGTAPELPSDAAFDSALDFALDSGGVQPGLEPLGVEAAVDVAIELTPPPPAEPVAILVPEAGPVSEPTPTEHMFLFSAPAPAPFDPAPGLAAAAVAAPAEPEPPAPISEEPTAPPTEAMAVGPAIEAAHASAPPAEPPPAAAPDAIDPAFTEGELQILDSLEARVAAGGEPAQTIKPGELVSALIRLLISKGLLSEAELIEELQKR